MMFQGTRPYGNSNTENHLTPHSFRHANTSLLAQAEVRLPEITERLGHGG